MTEKSSRDAAHFERIYAGSPDPWNFSGSAYEAEKYAATMAALGQRRFAVGFEAGCSIGVLTQRLAGCCDRLLAADIVPQALQAARLRCAALPHVTFAALQIPQDWPAQKFDLIVLSEILYFLDPADISRVAAHAVHSLSPGGTVLLVNYTAPTDDPCSGEQAAALFIEATAGMLQSLHQSHGSTYRIDVLGMAGSTSFL